MVLRGLVEQFGRDVAHISLVSATCRAGLAACFALVRRDLFDQVLEEPVYALHVAALGRRDQFGFASHRFYLARGFSPRSRGLAALQHYRNEATALDDAYREAVYRRGGLQLWRTDREGASFEIRLMPGQDVLNEGGLSVTFSTNGRIIFCLSYSNVDPSLLEGERAPAAARPAALVPFVTRRQAWRHPLRAEFTRAFGRGNPGHLVIAAMEGIALAQGCTRIFGIAAQHHPTRTLAIKQGRGGLEDMYDEFWSSVGGVRATPVAWQLPVPLRPRPLDELDSKNRRRAGVLRGHQAEVRDAAFRAFRAHLLAPPTAGSPPPSSPAPAAAERSA